MLQLDQAHITQCIIHKVGNAYASEPCIFSKKENTLDDLDQAELKKLLKPFRQALPPQEFTHAVDVENNTISKLVQQLFNETIGLLPASIHIVNFLFDQSTHHSIKAGEVFIMRLSGIQDDNRNMDGIGIFKIENATRFIKSYFEESSYSLYYDDGILSKNIEKGCLILQEKNETDCTIYSFEKNNSDTQYWQKNFLGLRKKSNDYNATNLLLDSVKTFVKDEVHEEGLNKTDQIAIFQNTLQTLADQEESINIATVVAKILPDEAQQERYFAFLNDFQDASGLQIDESINVSHEAIRHQQKYNKSVIKLDKTFHIYVHGPNPQMEQGVDDDGRKFYKLYYEEEG